MTHTYLVTIDQPIDSDASECIINAIECVDDDHWRDREDRVTVEKVSHPTDRVEG